MSTPVGFHCSCRFGHLSSAASDVEKYLHMLTKDEIAELLGGIFRKLEGSSSSMLTTIGWTITAFKAQQLLGATFAKSVEELEASVVILVDLFCKSLPLSRDLDPQENIYGEELLCIACDVLMQIFWRTRKLGYLLEAFLVLEFGLTIRRHVWSYKIRLVHIYSYMGALSLAYEWYRTLEVKNIMLESMSHHILQSMLRSPFVGNAFELLNEYLKFMDDYFREAGDFTCLAYRHRNYSKAVEFVQFKERLQRSFQYATAKCDSVVLQLKTNAENPDVVENTLEIINHGVKLLELLNEEKIHNLMFNEDFRTRPWWTPTTGLNFLLESFDDASAFACLDMKLHKSNVRENRSCDTKEAERKSLLPRLVYLSQQASVSLVKDCAEHNGTNSDVSGVKELKSLLDRYARNLGFASEDAINLIVTIALGNKTIKDLPSDIISWSSYAVFVNAWNFWSSESVIPSNDGACPSSWHVVNCIIRYAAQQLVQGSPILTSPGKSNDVFLLVQLVMEPISWHILIIQSCLRSAAPSGKKKKKGSGGTNERSSLPHLQEIRTSVQCMLDVIREILNWLCGQLDQSDDKYLDMLLPSLCYSENEVAPGRVFKRLEEYSRPGNADYGDRISQSLESWSSAAVLRNLIQAQLKMLNEVKSICSSKLKVLESLQLLTS